MLNYHELTMNEPRDSPQRRKQFLVICAIMFTMFMHAALNAGILVTVTIGEGTFPGGEFVYKLMTKDYAASTGTLRLVASDLGIDEMGSGNLIVREEGVQLDTADLLYSVLLDDPQLVPGGRTRFASGALLGGVGGGEAVKMKKQLLEINKDIGDAKQEAGASSKEVKYEVGKLPKVEAAVAQYPFTGGVWSALLQSYKIIPKFKKYAHGHGESDRTPIFISTCSESQKMCTYYMPLSKRDKFYMGKVTTEEYAKEFDHASMLQMMGIDIGGNQLSIGGINFGNVFRGLKKALGLGGVSKKIAGAGMHRSTGAGEL